MAKDKLTEYSATNASNDVIGDISVAEGMLPSAVNNALREQMTHLKNFSDGTDAIDALAVDNLRLDGNTISSTDTNGDITIDPDGTGVVSVTGTMTADGLTVDGDATISSGTPTLQLTDTGGTNQFATFKQDGSNLKILSRNNTISGGILMRRNVGGTETDAIQLSSNGDISFYDSTGVTQGLFWDASTQRLGLGTTSPSGTAEIYKSSVNSAIIGTSYSGHYFESQSDVGTDGFEIYQKHGSNSTRNSFIVNDNRTGSKSAAFLVRGDGNVGIGVSPARQVHMHNASGDNNFHITNSTTGSTATDGFSIVSQSSTNDVLFNQRETANMRFFTANDEKMRITSDGNLLVGKTIEDATTVGATMRPNGGIVSVRDGDTNVVLNRKTSDGTIIDLRKDNTNVGSIGCRDGFVTIYNGDTGLGFDAGSDHIRPISSAGSRDNAIDLGRSATRFDDIYATNGTIQTSDQNEKQQIASLTAAEITAAKAISQLFKTFKWNDKVEAKGDSARIHTGVIAQEVQTAMTDAGLDAADYAFWCSDTWTDDDGNSQTRMGIRYPELLAFVGAATEQRLADIETRLAALEAN